MTAKEAYLNLSLKEPSSLPNKVGTSFPSSWSFPMGGPPCPGVGPRRRKYAFERFLNGLFVRILSAESQIPGEKLTSIRE